jgi:hypothetical protein
MNKSEQLISCLEGEIKARDTRISELERYKRFESLYAEAERETAQLRAELARVTKADAHYQAEALRLAAELAALKAQEPAGFAILDNDTGKILPHAAFFMDRAKAEKLAALTGECSVASLYAAPVVSAEQQGVADGWKWVPVELTPEMLDAGNEAARSGGCDLYGLKRELLNGWAAMLAATPAPSTTEGQGDE